MLVPARSRSGSPHMPVGSGSLQVSAMLTPSRGGWSTNMPRKALNRKDSFTGTPIGESQSTVCSSLGGMLVNSATTTETSQGDVQRLGFNTSSIRRNAQSNSDLPDLESINAQRQLCLQEINNNLATLREILRETNAAKKLALKLQSEHVKRAYVFKIDHEVKVEEANSDRQANYELWQLQQAVAHSKALLEQQAGDALCEYEKQKRQPELQAEVSPVPTLEHCHWATSAQQPVSLIQTSILVMAPITYPTSAIGSDATTQAASPMATPTTSSFVPWPHGSCDHTTLSLDGWVATG